MRAHTRLSPRECYGQSISIGNFVWWIAIEFHSFSYRIVLPPTLLPLTHRRSIRSPATELLQALGAQRHMWDSKIVSDAVASETKICWKWTIVCGVQQMSGVVDFGVNCVCSLQQIIETRKSFWWIGPKYAINLRNWINFNGANFRRQNNNRSGKIFPFY